MAQGDLTKTIDSSYDGLYLRLKEDANTTVMELRRMVGDIQGSASAIHSASCEIASGSTDLSQRTTSQAAALEQSAASMEELTATVKSTAERAQEANDLAASAAQVANEGSAVVRQVVETMSAIDQSSREVADIISVIDGIAFQTNILALNAAVEAARAGDQGRGFAVVANEVRALAHSSAEASREIRALIDTATKNVQFGSAFAGSAGKKMDDVVGSSRRAAQIVASIMIASREQSEGIEQVNQTIAHMDELTQRNAALVDATSSAASALETQAVSLTSAISRFRLAGSAPAQGLAVRPNGRFRAAAPNAQRAKAAPAGAGPRRAHNGSGGNAWVELDPP